MVPKMLRGWKRVHW